MANCVELKKYSFEIVSSYVFFFCFAMLYKVIIYLFLIKFSHKYTSTIYKQRKLCTPSPLGFQLTYRYIFVHFSFSFFFLTLIIPNYTYSLSLQSWHLDIFLFLLLKHM